jgi:hypothetical protein
MPAVYHRVDLEPGITAIDAERAASEIARQHAMRVILVLPTVSVSIDAHGSVVAVLEHGLDRPAVVRGGLELR